MGLLDGEIKQIAYDALKEIFLDGTLIRKDEGSYDPKSASFSGGSGETTYSLKAIIEDYSDYSHAEGLVQHGDRKILVLAQSLSVTPQQDDMITVDSSERFQVIAIERDPAGALWEIQGRT